jgi:hypothetical protein
MRGALTIAQIPGCAGKMYWFATSLRNIGCAELIKIIMMQESKTHFAELAPANVGLGLAKYEQAAPREGPTKWDGSLEAKRRAYSEECKAFLLKWPFFFEK